MDDGADGSGDSLHRVSTVDAIVNALREAIFSGALPLGSALREAELCQKYGVSRHSLRTAFQALIQSGLAQREPSRSVTVTRLTPADVDDVYRLRLLLELEAVEVLCQTPTALGPVRDALNELVDLPASVDWTVLRDADLSFHRALVDALHRPRTSRVFLSLLDELRLAFLQVQPQLEERSAIVEQHRTIFDAVEAGDCVAAQQCVRAHLEQARLDITAAVREGDPVLPSTGALP